MSWFETSGLETLSWPVCSFVLDSLIFFYFSKMVYMHAQEFLNHRSCCCNCDKVHGVL
jgi:hypothetical protein